MFKILTTSILMGLLSGGIALANDGALPGTDIVRPQIDIQCDAAYHGNNYKKQIELCTKDASNYEIIITTLNTKYKNLSNKDYLVQEMRYDESYTLFEIAKGYNALGNVSKGHDYAVEAFNIYDDARMYFWAKINAAVGRKSTDTTPITYDSLSANQRIKLDNALDSNEKDLVQLYNELLTDIHTMYPDLSPQNSDT